MKVGIKIGSVLCFALNCFCLMSICKGWLAIAKLKPLSLFIALLSMLKTAFYNVRIEK